MRVWLLWCAVLLQAFLQAQALNRTFPDSFLLGFATSSYQIEGAWNEDGRGESLWDHYVHTKPDAIADKSNADIAADSYHKYKEDVKILKDTGAQIYRFSISWSRILPNGVNSVVNQAGIDYYNNLIDELLSNGIQPMVTLLHGDIPQRLQDLGGWTNPLIGNYFLKYAEVAFKAFGDRVKWWVTFNEPLETARADFAGTSGPPGLNMSGFAEYLVAYSVIHAHAQVYHLYDTQFRPKFNGQVGIVLDGGWNEPASNSSEDIEAAERANQFLVGMFAHPIYSESGDYPEVVKFRVGINSLVEGWDLTSRLPELTPEMISYIKGTADFFGMNYYTANLVSDSYFLEGPIPSLQRDMGVKMFQDPEWPEEGVGYQRVVPWGIRNFLNWIRTEYNNVPVFITECGYADRGEIEDDGRTNLYKEYLQEVLNAIYEDGCNVLGFTAWSLLDNFEWGFGYSVRYGIYSVDFNDPNRPRTAKKSAGFFKEILASRTLPEIDP